MSKATGIIRGFPFNCTSNYSQIFDDLETGMRVVNGANVLLVAIKDDDGWHKVPLNDEGEVVLSPNSYFHNSNCKIHTSDKYKEIMDRMNIENKNPKLA